MSDNVRIIKKYSNRRLYDMHASTYITQDTVKDYVSQGIQFRVVSTDTNEDITRSVLLHIILDEEIMGVPLFTEAALRSIIMLSGTAMRSSLTGFFEQMLPMLHKQNGIPPITTNNFFPGYTDIKDRYEEQLAVLQGMMMGNTFMENVTRNMKMVEEVNKSIVNNTAKLMKPPKTRTKAAKKTKTAKTTRSRKKK